MMLVRNLFLSMILCLGSCAVASAQSLSGPLSFRFDLQAAPFVTLTPGPGNEFNGPSPVSSRPWNWVVDINNLQVTATATLTSATETTFAPQLSLEGAVNIPGYTITGVTFNNTLPSGAFTADDFSSTQSFRLIDFSASLGGILSQTIPQGTQIVYQANFQVTPNPVPEPSTYALLGSGVVALGGYVRRRRRA